MGIPLVQITAIPPIAKMLGINRIVQGRAITNPVGDPTLPEEQEKELRRKFILRALELLQTDVEGPTVFTVEET
jgi:betaine reductase